MDQYNFSSSSLMDNYNKSLNLFVRSQKNIRLRRILLFDPQGFGYFSLMSNISCKLSRILLLEKIYAMNTDD